MLRCFLPLIGVISLAIVLPCVTRADEAFPMEEAPGGADLKPVTELRVTGAPRALTLAELPGSATVITPVVIEQRGINALADVIDTVPGLNFAGGSNRPRFFQIRGIGEFEQYEGAPNPSVGVIVDDIDFSGLGLPVALFDVEQLEVLRGPQGTRFGSSALAGALNVRSASPFSAYANRVELGLGNDDLRSSGVAIGGAIPGTAGALSARISSFQLRADGFRDNQFLGIDDSNRRDERTTRLSLAYRADAEHDLQLTLFNVENNNGYDAFAVDNSFNTQSDRPGLDRLKANAGSLKARLALTPQFDIEAVTAWLRANQEVDFDGDWGNDRFWGEFAPYDFSSATNRQRTTVSQEVRLRSRDDGYQHGDAYRSIAGVFAQRLSEDGAIRESASGEVYRALDSDYEAITVAGFGEVEVPIKRGTALSFGGRYERRAMQYDDSTRNSLNPLNMMLGGNVSLTHDISDRARGYITLARGFKGGGVNPGTRIQLEQRVFEPEYLVSAEAGVKGEWWQRRVLSEVAAFYQRREDAQLKFAFQNDPSDPLAFTYVTRSVAEANGWGLETTNRVRPIEWLELFATGAVLLAEYRDAPPENGNLRGRDPSHAPRWQYNTGAQVKFSEEWFLRGEVSARDAFYFDDSHDARADDYHLLHMSAGYRSGPWSVTVWGRNILDQNYAVRGFFFGNEPPDFTAKEYIQRGDPIAFGATVAYRW